MADRVAGRRMAHCVREDKERMEVFIGLDIGTSKLSAVALDAAGELVATVFRTNDADVSGLPPGHHEQAPRRIWELALDLLAELGRALAEVGGHVRALGLTGQMHGVLLADEALEPMTNLVTWQDRRAVEAGPDGAPFIVEFAERAGERALRDTGSRPATGYAAAALYWMDRSGRTPEGARWALTVHDWVAARLAGAGPVTDPTDAASTGLYNVRQGRWDERLLEAAGVPDALMPPVQEAGTAVGSVAHDLAAATGLGTEALVCTALGDCQAASLAALREPENEVVLNIGTGGQVGAVTGRFLHGPDLDVRPFPGGRLLSVGASLSGGAGFMYLAVHYARAIESIAGARVPLRDVLDALTGQARGVPPGADGLLVDPLFTGRRSDPALRGSIFGMSPSNNTPGHWARAFMEGLVDELHGYYQEMLDAGLAARGRLVGAGNGMRLNEVLREAAQRAFDMPLAVALWKEEAACGAALAAMVGAGALDGFAEAAGLVRHGPE